MQQDGKGISRNAVLYRHFDDEGRLLYVGISLSFLSRLEQHSHHAHWFEKIKHITVERFATREAALHAEKMAVKIERPLHNIQYSVSALPASFPAPHEHSSQRHIGDTTRPTFSIAEFCDAHHISRTHLHNMTKAGQGPRVMKVGRRTLISKESAADWVARMEHQTQPA